MLPEPTPEASGLGSVAISPPAVERMHEPSWVQERLWFISRLGFESPPWHVSAAVSLRGPFDWRALARALAEVMERHPALRTCFPAPDGRPRAEIRPVGALTPLRVDDIGASGARGGADGFATWLADRVRERFDLRRGPLFRVALLRLDADTHALVLSAHRIVCDEVSLQIVQSELRELYGSIACGRPSSLGPAACAYAALVDRQRESLRGEELRALLDFWTVRTAGLGSLELPSDRPRPPAQTFRGASWRTVLGAQALARLRGATQPLGVTLPVGLLAGLALVLHRYAGTTAIPLGYEVDGRSWPDSGGVVGPLANMLVLDLSLDPAGSFAGLLSSVGHTTAAALAHQRLPFELLLDAVRPRRSLSHTPLFQVLVASAPPWREQQAWGDAVGESIEVELGATRFDLVARLGDAGELTLEYNTDLFDADRIMRMGGHLQMVLAAAASDPHGELRSLPLLTEPERQRMLVEWNATEAEFPSARCVQQVIDDQVDLHPEARAVRCGEDWLTYSELDRRSNRIAHRLKRAGAGPDVLVGLCLERSVEMLAAMLGILKAGAAYVPLDPEYPPDRLAFMLEDSETKLLVTTAELERRLGFELPQVVCLDRDRAELEAESDRRLEPRASPGHLAYVIYTSGSTGTPKGVQIEHLALLNLLSAFRTLTEIMPADRLLAVTSLSFDIAGLELLMPLIVGAEVVLATRAVASDGPRLRDLLIASAATIMQGTPASWRLLLESGWQGGTLRTALCGGEAMPPDLAAELRSRAPATWNVYGPTETTIWSLAARIDSSSDPSIPIGRPIANTETYVLDAQLQPVPIGVPGELYLGGYGLARGYLRRPELTAQRFLANPVGHDPQARIYRTGDLASYRADGTLDFLGRTDHQVKVRGFRIELGEIEANLVDHPGVRSSVVVAREHSGERRLVAYLVAEDDSAPEDGDLRTWLRRSLPDYMIPEIFAFLPKLPLTPNGKVDRKALPEPPRTRPTVGGGMIAPRERYERELADIWKDVLGLQQPVGLTDNFFALGGNSLLAARLLVAVERWFHRTIPLTALFHEPTVGHLMSVIRSRDLDSSSPVIEVHPTGDRPPLFGFSLSLGLGGVLALRHLQPDLGAEQPVFAFLVAALPWVTSASTIEEIAEAFAGEVLNRQPDGPLFLFGHSLGGLVAYELATRFAAQGREIGLATMVDTLCPTVWRGGNVAERTGKRLARAARRAPLSRSRPLFVAGSDQLEGPAVSTLINGYFPPPYDGPLALFSTPGSVARAGDPMLGWRELLLGPAEVREVDGDHISILRKPGVDQLISGFIPLLRRHQEAAS